MLSAIVLLAAAVSATDLSARFVALLERDDLAAVMAAAGADADSGAADWIDLREAVVKHECIDVHFVRSTIRSATDDAVTLRVDLIASGVLFGAIKEEVLLPQVWFVAFARDGDAWRMTSARSRENRLAEELAKLPDDAARWELLRTSDHEPEGLARWLSYRIDEHPALWPFVREVAARSSKYAETNSYVFATTTFAQSDPARAKQYLQNARHLAEESGEPTAMARVHHAAAVVEWMTGNIDGAIREFLASAALVHRVRDPRNPMNALHMAAYLDIARGNVAAAAARAQQVVELSRHYGYAEGEINAHTMISTIHSYLGNRHEHEAANREAMRRAAAIGRRETVGAALYNLSLVEKANGNYGESEALLLRAAGMWKDAADRVPGGLGELRLLQGRLEQAERQYRVALANARAQKDEQDEIKTLCRLSELTARRGRPAEALSLAEEAVKLSSVASVRVGRAAPSWLPHFARGNALAALGRREEAVAAFETAIDLVEAEKSGAAGEASPTFLDDRIEPFLHLMRIRVTGRETAEALAVSERMKARLLRDLLSRGHVDMSEVLTAEERAEEEALSARVVERNRAVIAAYEAVTPELRDALEKARVDLRTFSVRMHLVHPELRAAVPPPAADDVRKWLDDARLVPAVDALVLDYIVGERETTLFALSRNASGGTDVRTFTLPVAKKDLAKRVKRLATIIERRELGYVEGAEDLYRRLLAPAAALIAGRKRICIIPHGVLWQLPFAVLRAPDGKHLVEKTSIHYAPSLAYLASRGAEDGWLPDKPRVLALGDPTVDATSLSRVRALTRATLGMLPEAVAEVREVGRLYPGSTVLVRREATEEAVKTNAAQHDILHFATHGISQPVQPLHSSLVLTAQSDREDGLLEAREIVRMNLPARLAVLSACETARGGISEGEGVIGLSWAFLAAGCARTIVTQWRTDSAAAAKAMTHFHRRVAGTKGGGSIAGALRDAQLALLRTPRYSHPYYWGGFVVVGAGW